MGYGIWLFLNSTIVLTIPINPTISNNKVKNNTKYITKTKYITYHTIAVTAAPKPTHPTTGTDIPAKSALVIKLEYIVISIPAGIDKYCATSFIHGLSAWF